MLYKSQSQSRIESIDIIRGAVMAIMALDHIREFLHSAALSFSPEDLTRTTPGHLLHALDHSLLRARIHVHRRVGRIPVGATRQEQEGAVVVSLDARTVAHCS
jgi:hypothetical protein